jgi:hypothetical protein
MVLKKSGLKGCPAKVREGKEIPRAEERILLPTAGEKILPRWSGEKPLWLGGGPQEPSNLLESVRQYLHVWLVHW